MHLGYHLWYRKLLVINQHHFRVLLKIMLVFQITLQTISKKSNQERDLHLFLFYLFVYLKDQSLRFTGENSDIVCCLFIL